LTVGQFEQALGCAPGDVEEHRVGESLVGGAQSRRQHAHDTPQKGRLAVEQLLDRRVRDGEHPRRFQCTRLRRPGQRVEQTHLTEQIAALHQSDDTLATVDRFVGDGDAATEDDEQLGRLVTFGEKDVAPDERASLTARDQRGPLIRLDLSEEIGGGQEIVGHWVGDYPRRVSEHVWTIVVAAGRGSRFGGPKQFEMLGARRMVDWSLEVATMVSDGVVVVVPAGASYDVAGVVAVAGGATRSDSVRCGLAAVDPDATVVCVHDAARPFADAALYATVIAAVRAGADGAVPGVAVADTIKRIDEHGVVVETPDREHLVAVQTPQAFRAQVLRRAHATGAQSTDDASLVEVIGGRVVVVPGVEGNRKITAPADLAWARRLVSS
jgi:2-C-methyl-D-erythritol 4-phosphate cytidylyltransferase